MKKLFVLLCLAFLLTVTGCDNNEDKVVCTMSATEMGMDMETTVDLSFNGQAFKAAKFSVDVKLNDSMKTYKSLLKSTLESTYNSQFGSGVKVKETSDGFNVSININEKTLSKITSSSDDSNRSYIIKSFEDSGYTCK